MNTEINRGMSSGDREILFFDAFTSNLELALQNNGDNIRSSVRVEYFSGASAQVVSRMEPVEAIENNSRFADTKFDQAEYESVWCYPKKYHKGLELERTDDQFAIVTNPSSQAMRTIALSLLRKESQEIIDATDRDIQVTTSNGGADVRAVSFDTNNVIAYDAFGTTEAAMGLTYRKLLALQELIGRREIMDRVTCLMPAPANTQLHQMDEIVSDNNFVMSELYDNVWVHKTLKQDYLHTNLVNTPDRQETVDTVDYDIYQIPVYTRDGLCLGVWEDMYTQVERNDIDRGGNTKLYAAKTVGATMTDINQNFKLEFAVKAS